MKFLILSLVILFSIHGNAKSGLIVVENIETITEDFATLKGTRWVNEGKQRVLLVHGFSENTMLFQDLAHKLHSMGYDVFAFNFRGHGNYENRSLVEGHSPKNVSKHGVYSFDRVITRDIPSMIDYVHDGKPILTLGHSLGGSALRFFLSGVRDYGDGVHLTKDSRKIQKYTNKVNALINLGSPTSFQKSDLRFRAWTKLPDSLTNLALNPLMRKYLGEYIFSGLINMDNIKDSERLFLEGFSLIPVDLIQDVQRWSDSIYSSRTGVQYEGLPVVREVPFFQIIGGVDNLVPLAEVTREHEEHRIVEKSNIIVMKNFGHVDMSFDQHSAELLSPIIHSVVKKNSIEEFKKNKKLLVIDLESRSLVCNKLF